MRTVIIGAGVVGLATAYELLRAGHEVTILERDTYGQGPSLGNAALVTGVLSFPVPAPGTIATAARSILSGDQAVTVRPRFEPGFVTFLARMAWATTKANFAVGTVAQDLLTTMVLDDYAEYVADGLEFERHEGGSMHVFDSRESFEAGLAIFDDFPSIKARITVLDGAEAVHAVDPNLASPISYGYLAPGDLQVEPASLMLALTQAIAAQGGRLIEHATVIDFVTEAGEVSAVVTTNGVFDADQVVIAAGVASRGLAAKLGFALPVYAGGGYSVDVHFEDAEAKPRCSVLTDGSHIAVTPLDWGLRASSGMIIGQPEPVVNRKAAAKLLADLHTTYPGVPLDGAQPAWAGLRPMSADGVPVIGLVPGWGNAYLATGHAMLGLTYAPSTAKVLRALMEGTAAAAFGMLSPRRFRWGR
jgi:D-amino-acid dehydrogenase